jgi:pimeloyl-ACP methyl ester carboxylesterase
MGALRALTMRDMLAYPARMDAELALSTLQAASGCAIAADLLAASKSGELFGDLGPIACPVTLATATRDRVFRGPSYFVKFRRLLPEARWIELDGLGHLPMSDDPDRVTQVIVEAASLH